MRVTKTLLKSSKRLARPADALRHSGGCLKADEVARLFDQTIHAMGALDILVNNARVYQAMPIAETD
jgi:NAD(P)-dependent dehydrogenase (short-subunit alcohol dehydrogenase family)